MVMLGKALPTGAECLSSKKNFKIVMGTKVDAQLSCPSFFLGVKHTSFFLGVKHTSDQSTCEGGINCHWAGHCLAMCSLKKNKNNHNQLGLCAKVKEKIQVVLGSKVDTPFLLDVNAPAPVSG